MRQFRIQILKIVSNLTSKTTTQAEIIKKSLPHRRDRAAELLSWLQQTENNKLFTKKEDRSQDF